MTGDGDHARTPAIEVSILGPLQVRRGKHELTLTTAPAVTFLILLSALGQWITKLRLQELVYGRVPDKQTSQNARRNVMDLRRALGNDGASVIAMTRTGGTSYRASSQLIQLDSLFHQRAVETATLALRARQLAEAAICFQEAEKLWRGVPLPELPALLPPFDNDQFKVFARDWAANLEDWHRAQIAGHAETLIRLGQHRIAIPRLRQYVTKHGGDSGLWCLLIIALYADQRDGEVAETTRDAIRAFDGRGLEQRRLRKLQQAVLGHRLPLDGAAALDAAEALGHGSAG